MEPFHGKRFVTAQVHICAILAYHAVVRPRLFSGRADEDGRTSGSLFHISVSAAAAAGVAGSLGAPLAAIFFAIELMSHFFLVDNLWASFVCVLGSTIVYRVLAHLMVIELFNPPTFPTVVTPLDAAWTLLLGAICGVLSFVYIKMIELSVWIREKFGVRQWRMRTVMLFAAALVVLVHMLESR